MLKLFLKFYLVIAIPLIFLFIPAINPVYKLINYWVEEVSSVEYESVFHLLDFELRDVEENNRQEYIKELNRHFGYQVALLPIDELELSNGKKKRIKNGEMVLQLGKITKLYKKAEGSESIYILDHNVSREDDADFAVKGAVYLANKQLENLPVEEWSAQLSKILKQTDLSVTIIPKSDAPVSVQKNPRLLDGKSVLDRHEKNLNTIYAPGPDRSFLYKIGTVDERSLGKRIEIATRILPATLLALGILFLAWPLYRDIRRLRKAAVDFGNAHLEKRVQLGAGSSLKPLAIAFNTMAARIQKLISSHKDLTNAVSHELKTPLTRLRFTHEMLREDSSDVDRNRHLDNIGRDVNELEEIIGELLLHARYDRPIRPAQFEEVDMQEWFVATLKPFQEGNSGIDIGFYFTGQASCICSIEKRGMGRAVENLISNALRYARSKVVASLDCTEQEVIFTVEDDGGGVEEADRLRLFEPFVRLDSSRHRKTGGSGLGLAITKQIIEMHGGTITCDSSRLGGACFTCRISKN